MGVDGAVVLPMGILVALVLALLAVVVGVLVLLRLGGGAGCAG